MNLTSFSVLRAKICFSSILNSGDFQIYFWFFGKQTAQECSLDKEKKTSHEGDDLGNIFFISKKSRTNLKRSSLNCQSEGGVLWVM